MLISARARDRDTRVAVARRLAALCADGSAPRHGRFAVEYAPRAMSRPAWKLLVLLSIFGCARSDAAPIPPAPPPTLAEPLALGSQDGGDGAVSTAAVPDVGGDAVVREVVGMGLTQSRVMDHVRALTEEIGPRLTGSHNLMRAETWCRDRFAEWGLAATLERWGEFPVGFDRGPATGRVLGDEPMELVFTTPAWTPGVLGPVRGPVVMLPQSPRDVAKAGASLKGAWVLAPARSRGHGRGEPDKSEVKLNDALRKAGIAGFIRRASDRGGDLVHTSGRSQIAWDDLPRDVEVVLQGKQHDVLAERVKAGKPVEVELSIDNRFFRGPVPQHNVVADIPGTDKADEYVIVGGHLDSWDGATGANDNATGVATTMEAARLLMAAGAKPRRTIRFMLWTGEEQGLLGSEGWVEAHTADMERISAVLVHDGGTNLLTGLHVTPEMMPQMQQALAPVLRLGTEEYPFALQETDGLRPGGSDHTPFIKAGVPGFFWDQDGRSDYDFVHHTQHDTLEHVIPEYQVRSAVVVALSAYGLANLDEKLDRTNSAPVPRRRIGANLDDTKVRTLEDDGVAKKAGLKEGDTIVEIDGQAVKTTRELMRAVNVGEAKKAVVVERDGARVQATLDWSGDPGEAERAARRQARANAK
jgi:carboxypeptidase Q